MGNQPNLFVWVICVEMEERKYRGLKVLFKNKDIEKINEIIRRAVVKWLASDGDDEEDEVYSW